MATVESIKRKIKTAEDLHAVVKTMKILAAVSIRQYEKAVASLAHYNRTVEMGLQVVLSQRPEPLAPAEPEPSTRLGAVIFGSDQGMCGPLNDQIVSQALGGMAQLGAPPENRALIAVGIRVAERLGNAGHPVEEILPVPGSTSGIIPLVQELVRILEEWHFRRNIKRVQLFFCEHLSGAAYRPYNLQLLPLDSQWLGRIRDRKWPTRNLPTFSMDWARLFSGLIRQYFFVSLYRAFAESLASENASRLASMQKAEKNIEERLDGLQAQFHRQRQMSITGELLDIVAGFEALTDRKDSQGKIINPE